MSINIRGMLYYFRLTTFATMTKREADDLLPAYAAAFCLYRGERTYKYRFA